MSASPTAVRNASFTQQNHTNISPVQQSNSQQFSPPSKRKSSTGTTTNSHEAQNGTDENGKKKRRKVNHACVYCRRSHMTCDLQRPCARCVKRDIGHLCHDEPRDPPKRGKSESGGPADIAPAPDDSGGGGAYVAAGADGMEGTGPTIVQPTPISPKQLRAQPAATLAPAANMTGMGSLGNMNFDWNNSNMQNQFQDMHHLHPNYMFNTSEVTNEYNMLNDFLTNSLNDDGQLFNNTDGNGISTDAANVFLNDPMLSGSGMNTLQQQQPQNAFAQPQQPPNQNQNQNQHQPAPPLVPPARLAEEISRPSSAFPISEATRNKFYMTAADPAGLSTGEDRLHKILKGKYDAGMLRPFNYVKGYARLNNYMSAHLSRESQVRILKQLERFRPQFRSAMQSLTDMQLVLVEMWFERSLMEYDRVFASMAIPACCWRRTGEIFRGNREFAELVGVGWERLRDGRLAIHEVLGEESLVSYWEKFGAIAFDGSQKAILTSCSLRRLDVKGREGGGGEGDIGGGKGAGGKEKGLQKCCFSFTIRRDTHNM